LSGRQLLAAFALWAGAGAACGVIGDKETLTDAQGVIAAMKIGASDKKDADPQDADPQGAGLKVVGAVDHADRSYRLGEPIGVSVRVNQAAYVAVLRVMPNGATTLVFPNRRQVTARVPPDSPLRIPEPGGPLKITADKPGAVLLEFVASSRGDSWLFNRKPEGSADFAELGTTTRALAKDIALSVRAGHGADTAASHLVLRVRGD
jgi:Domain of unknown function (DUF4384)